MSARERAKGAAAEREVLDRRDDLDGAEREAIAEALRAATILAAGAWRRLHGALAIVGVADAEREPA